MSDAQVKGWITVADAKRVLGMDDPITVNDAARLMRIRYAVALRLVKSGKLIGQQLGARYFIERAEALRGRREKPWAPWAMRVTVNGHRRRRRPARDIR